MLVEKDFTIKPLSREYLLIVFGEAIADEVYPQDRGRGISKETKELYKVITEIVLGEINENGYIVVNEIKGKVKDYAGSLNWADYKYKQVEIELLEEQGLKKISLTNALREELEITHLKPNARPKILMK